MARPRALTDEQIVEVQRAYQKNKRHGAIADLMRRYEVSRPTIMAALEATVTVKERSPDQQKQDPKTKSAGGEATQPFIPHSLACRCRLCHFHSMGFRYLTADGRHVSLEGFEDWEDHGGEG